MFKLLAPVVLWPLIVVQAEQKIPAFDVSQGCRGGIAAAQISGRRVEDCMRQEQEAVDKIKDQWDTFTAEERTRCFSMASTGGMPSYVEALTCMQVGREVRKINDPTTGQSRQ